MSTDPESRGGFGPYLEGVGPTYVDNGCVRTIRFGEILDLERALELYGKNVAAFLVEPIQGEAGYVSLPLLISISLNINYNLGLSSLQAVTYPGCTKYARNIMSC